VKFVQDRKGFGEDGGGSAKRIIAALSTEPSAETARNSPNPQYEIAEFAITFIVCKQNEIHRRISFCRVRILM